MSNFLLINKNDLSGKSFLPAFFEKKEAQGFVVNPKSGLSSSDTYELPFIIETTNMSVPIISEDFCLVSRVKINLSEQHVYEREATISGNNSLKNPKATLKENNSFIELKGASENG